jgi:hypothetical protein
VRRGERQDRIAVKDSQLKLELETLKIFLAEIYPDFDKRFQTLREKVRMEVSPE